VSTQVQTGYLLVASVSLVDPNFQGAVVLICEHEEEQGTYGLVLNRSIEIPDELREEIPFVQDQLYVGGPVQQEVLQVLHPYGEDIPGARQVLPGVWVGGDFDVIRRNILANRMPVGKFRFFLGYSGWAKGQLADEILADSWLVVPATPHLVFDIPPDQMWTQAVRARGQRDPVLNHYPKDPRWN